MEYSLTDYCQRPFADGSVLILILMEYSLTCFKWSRTKRHGSLNPYSNGILTDNLSESELHFQPSIFSYSLPTFYQEVKPMETFFSQMRRIEKRIPNKNGAFFKHLSGCQTLASSQDQTPSKLFPGFAKNPKREICKGLVMNTLLHRAEADTDAFSQM